MEYIPHPKEMFSPGTVEKIRNHAFEIEQAGKLNAECLQYVYKGKALRVLIPECCGGLEWPLPKTVAFFEALAWVDGNLGWLVNLGAGANMFAGYMEQPVAQTLFADPETWCAGSGAVSGTAIRTKGGYILSGRWKYASGADHATHFTANALLLDEEKQPVLKEGEQTFRSFIFPAREVIVLDTWKVTGLKATSSKDFSVKQLFVPDAHVFSLMRPSDFASGPLYRFPFEVLAVVNMACMPTGMALHFADLFNALAEKKKPLHSDKTLKEDPKVKSIAQVAMHRFMDARAEMYNALEEAWSFYEKGGTAEQEVLDRLVFASKKAAEEARKMVFELYPLCGMNMVFYGSELNKVWRDMAVASQHYVLSPAI